MKGMKFYMEFLVVAIFSIISIFMLFFIFSVNMKKLKDMTNIKELDDISNKYPSNIEICKEYLKNLKNENVQIEENKDSDATVYIAVTNKISIGNLRNSYTRIQTIAHECLHSIQNRKILLFNFIFSNIYLLYFFVVLVLSVFGKLQNQMTYVAILAILGVIYLVVRMYLEDDAMIKARYLAKEYLEEKNISEKEQIDKLVKQYDVVNDLGIRCVHYQLFLSVLSKVAILSLICFWR